MDEVSAAFVLFGREDCLRIVNGVLVSLARSSGPAGATRDRSTRRPGPSWRAGLP
jgi:hypothetical protein